jgi:hypothetical protein
MQELETTWPRVLAVWWLIIWRGLVGAFLLGVALGRPSPSSGFSPECRAS